MLAPKRFSFICSFRYISLQNYLKKLLNLAGIFLVCSSIGLYVTSASASGGDVSSINNALQGLIDILTGKSARLVAVLTIAGVGYMTLCGRLPIKHAVYVCLGIGIIFGATTIASLLGA